MHAIWIGIWYDEQARVDEHVCASAGLLHWFTSPYVHRLVFDRTSQTLKLETLSVFARRQTTKAHLSQVAYPDTLKPQVTFQVWCMPLVISGLHLPQCLVIGIC